MSTRRGLGLLAGALLAAALLSAAASALPAPPLAGPRELEGWWTSNGTAVVAFSLVRIVGLALSGYVALLGLVGTIAALTRWSWADGMLEMCATPAVRRLLVGGGLVASLSMSSVGAARAPTIFEIRDLGPARAPTIFEIRDLGPAGDDSDLPELDRAGDDFDLPELGPIGASRAAVEVLADVTTAETELDSWVVARGDHLWSIAAATVADRGEDDRESTIAAYWLQLIEENRELVGDNPDLIHPGQIIRLPR